MPGAGRERYQDRAGHLARLRRMHVELHGHTSICLVCLGSFSLEDSSELRRRRRRRRRGAPSRGLAVCLVAAVAPLLHGTAKFAIHICQQQNMSTRMGNDGFVQLERIVQLAPGGRVSCPRIFYYALLLMLGALFAVVVSLATRNQRLSSQLAMQQPIAPQLDQPPLACPNYSPAYPSRGGADCPAECLVPGSQSVAAGYFNVFPASFNSRVHEVGLLIQGSGPAGATTYVEGEHGFMDSHVTFGYYCCQTAEELSRIRHVLEDWDWESSEETVGFSFATCAIDGPSIEHVSLILMLDAASNLKMNRLVQRVESAIEAAGVRLNVKRAEQEPFHTTLAVVNGSLYPVGEVVAALNARFPANSWETITLTRPCQAHGTTPAGFFC